MWVGHSCPTPLTLFLTLICFWLCFCFDLDLVGDSQMSKQLLERKYDYRRKLPHYQTAERTLFITFCKGNQIPFTPQTRDVILQHCLHDNGKRYELHAAVVMPDHVHLLLTPMRDDKGWPYALPQILKLLKGTSARAINKVLHSSGPIWQEESFDHVLRSQESFEQKREYVRQNPVRRGLVKKPEDYPWLWLEPSSCGTDTAVRRF
jgi:putative transposase